MGNRLFLRPVLGLFFAASAAFCAREARAADAVASAKAPALAGPAWLQELKGGHTQGEFVSHLSAGFSGGATPAGTTTQEWNLQGDTRKSDAATTFRADAAWFYSVADRKATRSSGQAHAMQDWKWDDSSWLSFARGEAQYDRFRPWEWRLAGYGGLGYALRDDADWEIIARGGLGGRYDFGDANEFTPETVIGGSAAGWRIAANQKVVGEAMAYIGMDGDSPWRFSGKAEWQVTLSEEHKTLLKIGVRDQYESQRPANQSGHDLHYYMGIGVEL